MRTMIERDLEGWTLAFDLDGTLVETHGDLVGTLNHPQCAARNAGIGGKGRTVAFATLAAMAMAHRFWRR